MEIQQPTTLLVSKPTPPDLAWPKILIPLIVLAVLVVGYGVLSKNYGWWPHEVVASPSPSTPDVDITDWQTYRDEQDGFEIKYPQEWELSGKNVLATNSSAPGCNCNIFFEKPADLTRIKILKDRVGNEEKTVIANLEWYTSPYFEMKVSGNDAQAGDPSPPYFRVPIRTLYTEQKDYVFAIHLESMGVKNTEEMDPVDPKEIQVFWQILSTFKFLN